MATEMKLITDIALELTGETKRYEVVAKQGDKATRFVRITLKNNGQDFEIPAGMKVIANIQKPDKKCCYNTCSYSGSTVTMELTNQALAVAGTAECDIEIRDANDEVVLSSQAFTIEIEKSMRDENAIRSSNEFTQLEQDVREYAKKYFEENPVSGMTEEQEEQLSENTDDIIDLKSANGSLIINIFNLAQTMETVFKNTVFRSANTQAYDYLSSLVQQLKPEGMVSVKYSLTNCTINTSVAYVMKGSTFTATISPDKNTEFQSLTVNMGGVDVTGTVVIDKTINISNVTGDIVITAISKKLFIADGYEALDYVYSSRNGDAYINTDWIMTDLKEKIVIGVQLSETNPTNTVGAFLGVNADSAFSSIYTAIELAQQSVNKISVGWGSYQPTSNSFAARYNEDLKSKIHYVSLTNGEQKLWENEDMNVLYTGQFAANTQKYTMDDSRIPPFPVWLFRSNIQDVAYQSAAKKTYRSPGVKISCFKVYDGDGILTVNMRAAKRSNDGVVGFYDTVRKRFFENACDTGDLIGG